MNENQVDFWRDRNWKFPVHLLKLCDGFSEILSQFLPKAGYNNFIELYDCTNKFNSFVLSRERQLLCWYK